MNPNNGTLPQPGQNGGPINQPQNGTVPSATQPEITQPSATQSPGENSPGLMGGRPSLYDPKYCEMLVDHMAKGYSFESFAAGIGVHRATLYNWIETHTEFDEAVKIGLEKSLYFWETIGIQGVAGKIKNFNNGTYALTMANKHRWKQRQDITSDDSKIESPILYIPKEENDK